MSHGGVRRRLMQSGLVAGMLFSLLCLPVSGQYFGQNKVRYNDFDFKILKTENFDIFYYPEAGDFIDHAGRMAERWYYRLSSVLGFRLSSRQTLIIYADHPDFQQTQVIAGVIGESTGGVTESLRRRIVMPLAGPVGDTDHVIGHELVHAFQYDLSSRVQRAGVGASLGSLPLWFVEGMAEYLSIGPVDPFTSMWMRDAVLRQDFPAIAELDGYRYFPYRWGHALWAFIAGKHGDEVLGPILRAGVESGDAQEAIGSVLNVSMEDLSGQWHRALKDRYGTVVKQADSAEDKGEIIVSKEKSGTEINVSPAISPDGKYAVLFSERSLFGINLFLVDAQTGKFLRKITETEISPHFINLQFTNAVGAWSADGRHFAFPGVRGATPEMSIYDVLEGKISRKIPVREVGEIYNLSWSPDGKSIAFAAIQGGLTDIFTISLESNEIQRLTDDAYGDLQPSWSPDGTKIAFATDRFTTNLADLAFGEFRLALYDLRSGNITSLPGFEEGKHMNPEWSPDGTGLYFISDRDGTPDIYHLTVNDGAIDRVTSLDIGASGITRFSPAMSVARNSGSILFSEFDGGSYRVVRIEPGTGGSARQPSERKTDDQSVRVLPPVERTGAKIRPLLEAPTRGLTGTEKFSTEEYSAGLQLEYVTPVSVSFGTSRYGNMVGGGIGFLFSDILNYHELSLELQTTSLSGDHLLRNMSGTGVYLNKRNRWTWGVAGGQTPYLTAGFEQGVGLVGGEPVIFQSDTTIWQIERQFAGLLQYPFNRALRAEFSTGFRNVDFAASRDLRIYDPATGFLLGSDSEDISAPDSLYFSTSSAALVYDTSIFGGVSPVIGQRYRLETGVNAGSLTYATALADYRRYFQIARPVSVAGRVLHYGRYGGDSEDARMQQLFLGYSSTVRGYEAGSISAMECGPALAETGACPIIDRLLGSRIGVANLEMRFEILGPLGIAPSGGFPPVQIAPFFDAGIAWTSDEAPDFFGGSRSGVTSHGISLRFNMLGFFVGQLSLVHPNDRPMKGWMWEFSFLPGF
ncbi:MAG: PD40 domain-containing protein [Acidobacteria bacterium]|nr:PD40 domain-containing protein [Acidobacteriota bacterium]